MTLYINILNLVFFVSRFMYKEFDCYFERVIVRVFGTFDVCWFFYKKTAVNLNMRCCDGKKILTRSYKIVNDEMKTENRVTQKPEA